MAAALARRVAPAVEGVNFGDLSMYVAGGGLPEGDYVLTFTAQMYQAQSQAGVSKGPARLGIMVEAVSLTDPSAEPRHQFYSLGSSADKSFAPNPETGKGLVPVPGGAASNFNNSTNWAFFIKSMYDCGLPNGVFTNDLTTIDGVHVHMSNVPEPEERKGFQSKTGEGADDVRKNGTIAIVTEIKDNGKPWEGTGGIPKAGAKPVAAAAKKTTAPAAPLAVAAAPAAAEDADLQTAALNSIADVLTDQPKGAPKLVIRTGAFRKAQAMYGDPTATAIIDTYFKDDAALNRVLGELGYVSVGGKVQPI